MDAATAATAATGGGGLPISFTAVYIVGFIAAVTLGSVAWYNSKRPVGWEDKERPGSVPEVNKSDNPGVGKG